MKLRLLPLVCASIYLALGQGVSLGQSLAHFAPTNGTLTPTFSPSTFDYAATLPSEASGLALFSAPPDPALRLFLRPVNSVFQEVSIGPTIAVGRLHSLVLRADGGVVAWGDASNGKTSVPSAAGTDVVAVAAGDDHSLALKRNGSVIAWGDNASGQTTVPAEALSGVVAIAAGASKSYALKSDGSVISWGPDTLPPEVSENVTAIAAGSAHAIALKTDGSVVGWGSFDYVPPEAQSGVIAIAAGGDRSLALKADGTVLVWGNGSEAVLSSPSEARGALALAADRDHNLAIRPDGSVFIWGETAPDPLLEPPGTIASEIVAIAVRESRALALKRDGTLVSWGLQSGDLQTIPLRALAGLRLPLSAAQLVRYGANATEIRVAPSPTPVSAAIPAASLRGRTLSAMDGNRLAVRTDGTVVSWGQRVPGVLTLPSPAPANVVSVAVGGQHGLALKADGTVTAWGTNSFGQTTVPAEATDFVAIAAGYNYSVGLRANGRVVGWGQNAATTFAVPAAALSDVVAISASLNHNLALKADGSVIAWGYAPLTVTPASVASGVMAVAAGYNYSLALKTDGSVMAWNDGTSSSPSVLLLSVPSDAIGVVAIAAGQGNALALRSDGRVVAWGLSDYGVLDVPVEAQSGVVAIAMSYYQAFALRSDGTVVSWGSSAGATPTTIAQTGILAPPSTFPAISRPVDLLAPRVPLATATGACFALRTDGTIAAWGTGTTGTLAPPTGSFVALEGGSDHVLALRADGSVVGWGSNSSGTGKVTPPATASSDVIAVSAGSSFSLALKRDGSVLVWGTTSSSLLTVPPLSPESGGPTGHRYTAIAASDATAFALRSDGRVIAWGSSTSNLTTVPTAAQSGVVAIAAGAFNALALKTDGKIVAWGDNSYGQAAGLTPRSPAVAITAGSLYTAALLADGSVAVWGYSGNFVTSVPVAAQSGVVSLVGGPTHLVALKSDGTLVRWGSTSGTPPYPLEVLRPGPPGTAYRLTIQRPFPSPALASLASSAGAFTPVFDPATTVYTQTTSFATAALQLDASPETASASVRYRFNGAPSKAGPSASLPLRVGFNQIRVRVSPDGRPLSDAPLAASSLRNLAVSSTGAVMHVYASTSASSLPSLPAESQADVRSVFSGSYGDYALKTDGTLVRLGGSNVPTDAQPTAVGVSPARAPIASVSVGSNHVLILRTDGTTYAWGTLPAIPAGAQSDVVAIASGSNHATALRADGRVVAWGSSNSFGETSVPPGCKADIVAIAAYGQRNLALRADGLVIPWGYISYPADYAPSAALSGVVAIAAGEKINLALKADGSVIAWGTAASSALQIPLAAQSGVVAITVGPNHQLALKADGTVVAWGSPNGSAAVAPGFPAPLVDAPVRDYHLFLERRLPAAALASLTTNLGAFSPAFAPETTAYVSAATTPYTAVALHGLPFANHPALEVRTGSEAFTPVTTGQSVSIGIYAYNGAALRADGSVMAWGSDISSVPTAAQSGVLSVAVGRTHAIALKQDGTLVGWGLSSAGASAPPAGIKATAIAAGDDLSITIQPGGSPAIWGRVYGTALAQIPDDAVDLVAIALEQSTNQPAALALRRDGRVVTWGGSSWAPPIPADALSNVIAIASGWGFHLALRQDGRVVAWGGLTALTNVPNAANYGVVAIAAGAGYALALKGDGSVICWGETNGSYILPASSTPSIGGQSDIIGITAGSNHSFGLRRDGTVRLLGSKPPSSPAELLTAPLVLPLSSRLPLTTGANRIELRATARDASESLTYAIDVTRTAAPVLALFPTDAAAPVYPIIDGATYTNFGVQKVGTTLGPRSWTILNTGDADLILSFGRLGNQVSSSFSLTGLDQPLTLTPGSQTTFNLSVTPASAGSHSNTVLLYTNLPQNGFFFMPVVVTGVTLASEIASWRSNRFTSAELADPALEATLWGNLADPDGDGMPNLLEYAFYTLPKTAGAAPWSVALDATNPAAPRLHLTYTRVKRLAIAGLVYEVQWSDDLAAGSWSAADAMETITASNTTTETVVASVPLSGSNRFLRLRVTAP